MIVNKEEALFSLREMLDDDRVVFRTGQWEAIDQVVNHKRKVLVVERTGWGKSIVYFLSTKLLRKQHFGPTIIVSPLLSLMRNQLTSIEKSSLNMEKIDSTNNDDWEEIYSKFAKNEVDVLFISPERLSNDDFLQYFSKISNNIGLFVVDEAHCISDWGHDFRPDYQRITSILKQMPRGMPVLCTTATANNRVIADINKQLGDLVIQKGSLLRKSLYLQTKNMFSKEERLAWLLEYLPQIEGTGLIYTLTIRDANNVARWLKLNNCNVESYHGDLETDERKYLEGLLMANQLKALVTTNALGMGYDKPDIKFVIHYQVPGSLVAYYQQVGRAGRKVPKAFGFAMRGIEDKKINDYFIEEAFPKPNIIKDILDLIGKFDGLSRNQIEEKLNVKSKAIEFTLKYLSSQDPSPITKIDRLYKRTAINFQLDQRKIDYISSLRNKEQNEMYAYIKETSCLMKTLGNHLNDDEINDCGKCQNCVGENIYSTEVHQKFLEKAKLFLNKSEEVIRPRMRIPKASINEYTFKLNQYYYREGKCLSRWDDGLWGSFVKEDKLKGEFREDLINQTVSMIKRWNPAPKPTSICFVPSLNKKELVHGFAQKLASKLDINFRPIIEKVKENKLQKLQNNRFSQYNNLDGVFKIKENEIIKGPIFLFDDIIDSGTTIHICAALLYQQGVKDIFPITLSNTGRN